MQKMTQKYTLKSRIFLNENHDNCTGCGRDFKNDDTTHLGYSDTGDLINVGDCCSERLKETIVRHVFRERVYKVPEKETVLWRFMDFTKFVSLLSTKSLFFTRADLFEDPFEGAKGILKNKNKWDKHYLDFFKTAIQSLPEPHKNDKTETEVDKEAIKLLKQMDSIGAKDKERTYINCWHENSFESEAMWKLYTTNLDHGVAIKTTFDKLHRSIKRNPNISIGRINYIDFNSKFAGVNDSFWYKRKSFEHEKEVRAIMKDFLGNGDKGKLITADLRILIDKVYVSPTSPKWITDLIKEIMEKYGLKKKVYQSGLNEEPFH